jgi:hypothetical protein
MPQRHQDPVVIQAVQAIETARLISVLKKTAEIGTANSISNEPTTRTGRFITPQLGQEHVKQYWNVIRYAH